MDCIIICDPGPEKMTWFPAFFYCLICQ